MPKRNRHVFHFGVPRQKGTVSVPVAVTDGEVVVKIQRSVEDVKRGYPGIAVACADMRCTSRNKKQFPHDVHFVEFTRSRVYICDKEMGGIPTHCVVYQHNDDTIHMFDEPGGKGRLLKSGEAEREIIIKPPRYHGDQRKSKTHKFRVTGERGKPVPLSRGSKRRAIEAGLITALKKYAA